LHPPFLGYIYNLAMSIAQSLLPEFDHEMANTRKAIERAPDDKFTWKPHDRSNDMGWMINHLSNLPLWLTVTLSTEELDINPPGGSNIKLPKGNNRAEVLANFDQAVADARAALAKSSDADMMKPWTMLNAGKAAFTMPRIAVLRSFVMNHMVHHRGQLTVYFRLNDIPVPSLYGPSADEGR
jgi:uncharacterized damage-inducible protein DinB